MSLYVRLYRASPVFFIGLLLFSLVTGPLIISQQALAIDSDYYQANGIVFSDPHASLCVDTLSSANSPGINKDYKGNPVFTDAELGTINKFQPLYEQAMATEGYPWQLLAVIHYMETGLARVNPSNGQGLFQDYSKSHPDWYTPGANVDDALFLKEASQAVAELNSKIAASGVSGMKKVTKDDIKNKDPDSIKEILLLYNGLGGSHYSQKAQALGYGEKIYEGSPYVMNRADAPRDPTDTANMNAAWPGIYTNDGVYTAGATSDRYGTYVRFAALAGILASSNCGTNNGGIVAGNILETAKNLAWDQPFTTRPQNSDFKSLAKPSFVAAVKQDGKLALDSPGTYADCGMFVSTVMHVSGADANYPNSGTTIQYNYVTSHPEKYQIINSPTKADLQPGDIIVTAQGGHTAFYGGNLGTSASGQPLVAIEASLMQRVPSWVTTPYLDFTLNLPGVVAARMK